MFGKILCIAVGAYAGIYADQNYKIPKVTAPKVLWAKMKEFAELHRKDVEDFADQQKKKMEEFADKHKKLEVAADPDKKME